MCLVERLLWWGCSWIRLVPLLLRLWLSVPLLLRRISLLRGVALLSRVARLLHWCLLCRILRRCHLDWLTIDRLTTGSVLRILPWWQWLVCRVHNLWLNDIRTGVSTAEEPTNADNNANEKGKGANR